MVTLTQQSYDSLCAANNQLDKLSKFLVDKLPKYAFFPTKEGDEGEGTGDAAIRLLKEYEQLVKNSAFLLCLETAGVDNWEGYGEARSSFRQWEEKYGQ